MSPRNLLRWSSAEFGRGFFLFFKSSCYIFFFSFFTNVAMEEALDSRAAALYRIHERLGKGVSLEQCRCSHKEPSGAASHAGKAGNLQRVGSEQHFEADFFVTVIHDWALTNLHRNDLITPAYKWRTRIATTLMRCFLLVSPKSSPLMLVYYMLSHGFRPMEWSGGPVIDGRTRHVLFFNQNHSAFPVLTWGF